MARVSIEIDATPEAVWSVLADAVAYGDWVVRTKQVLRADADCPRPQPGTQLEHELGVGRSRSAIARWWSNRSRRACSSCARSFAVSVRPRSLELEPYADATRVVMDESRWEGCWTLLTLRSATRCSRSGTRWRSTDSTQHPFLIFGQYSMVDPSRQPPGKETAWAYTHVPQRVRGDAGGSLTGRWDAAELAELTERCEREIERLAPGFTSLVRRRRVLGPADLERADANLAGGALNGGSAQLHQQLIFRPTSSFGRPDTPIRALYLASASIHPGGGVHGGPGAIAARTALNEHRLKRTAVAVGVGASAAGALLRR